MFTKHLDLVDNLKTNNPVFGYLFKKYERLEEEIARSERDKKMGAKTFCPKALQKLKQEKRILHTEIYLIVRRIQSKVNHFM